MSHQVVITFDMDENQVAQYAEKEAGRQIARDVIEEAFGSSYSRQGLMKNYVYQAIREILEPEKEQIIADAIKEVVGTLSRTKMVREKMEDALNNED